MSRVTARLGEFRHEVRWTVVVVVLAVLAAVALWPRDPGRETEAAPPASAGVDRTDPARLAELRDRTRLAPCPSAATAGPEKLSGARGTCMADGAPVDVAAATAGKPTLINVWATWCPPCRKELPVLQEYSRQPGAVRVLGVQVQSDQAAGLELLDSLGVRFPSVHDSDRSISGALNVPTVLPASYLVTASGAVHRLDPEVFESPDEVRAAVSEITGAAR
ncbi:thiol-disulfide isomerase/thioredoxin [Saccharopolyspora lacisalsi]|uniref:Thiol-disulfide isomerase/thioredoxin n=1 Tax=Halosaccharopolyspora lacisalsi TaxID=1000566 RepID=A0A839E6P6_9PSEU|nr:TlpA disulfide reductase family protein [Halosaccharopolyspora lacisalsi]MBA8827377.1 thiol-disulfide isomerase/thioredoxin [Halosaccharopolyspora lacisalsi]